MPSPPQASSSAGHSNRPVLRPTVTYGLVEQDLKKAEQDLQNIDPHDPAYSTKKREIENYAEVLAAFDKFDMVKRDYFLVRRRDDQYHQDITRPPYNLYKVVEGSRKAMDKALKAVRDVEEKVKTRRTKGKAIPDKLIAELEDHRRKYETAQAVYYDDVRELEVWTRDIGRYDSSPFNEGRYVDYLERLRKQKDSADKALGDLVTKVYGVGRGYREDEKPIAAVRCRIVEARARLEAQPRQSSDSHTKRNPVSNRFPDETFALARFNPPSLPLSLLT